jgi:16S rRNA processing protein RimM
MCVMPLKTIRIGKIVNTHGIKGELKVLPDTDFQEERYLPDNPLFIGFGDQMLPVRVKKYRPHQGFDLLTFAGMEDINVAEKYKGCLLFSEDRPIRHLAPNEFQAERLIGINVTQNGKEVGTVAGIRVYPQGDYLEVSRPDGTISLVPFRDEFIVSIDEVHHVLAVVDMEGLL